MVQNAFHELQHHQLAKIFLGFAVVQPFDPQGLTVFMQAEAAPEQVVESIQIVAGFPREIFREQAVDFVVEALDIIETASIDDDFMHGGSLLFFLFPLEQVGHSVRIVAILDECGQFCAGQLRAFAAMGKTFLRCALIDTAIAPEDVPFLRSTAFTVEFFAELAGRAIRSAFSFDDGHLLPLLYSIPPPSIDQRAFSLNVISNSPRVSGKSVEGFPVRQFSINAV